MTTITVTLTPPNPLTDSQATFNSKALAFTQALPSWAAQANTMAGELNTAAASASADAVTASTAATTATTQAGTATTKAAEALSSANAAAAHVASIPVGTINDSLIGAGTVYSSTKTEATYAKYSGGTWTGSHVYQSSITETPVTANTSTAYTVTDRSIHNLTLTGNCTLTFPTQVIGKQFTLLLKQDATGSRTITWPSTVRWQGGSAPVPTSTASRTDVYSFISDGTYWLGFVAGQNYTRA